MLENYIKAVKEIKALQQELIELDNKMKTTKNNISILEEQKNELEEKRKEYNSKIKTLMMLEENKHRINSPKLVKDIEDDLKLLFSSTNHITAKIASIKQHIYDNNLVYKNFETSKNITIGRLKRQYTIRDIFLEELIKANDRGTPQENTKKYTK